VGFVVPIELRLPKLLLGEGTEEKYFFYALLTHLEIKDVQFLNYDGKTNLGSFLKTLPKLSHFSDVQSIGITRDADEHVPRAFQSVADALRRAGLAVPNALNTWTSCTPHVAVFLMPDCKAPGMLEDLCIQSLRDRPEWKCIGPFFECVRNACSWEASRHPYSKAQLRAWLTTCDPPDLQLGQASAAGKIEFGHSAFAQLKTFLQSL
jgi:hypothetical protein